MVPTRSTPLRRKAASSTSSLPVREPVCDAAALAAAAERPGLLMMFWLCWEWIRDPERRWLFASYAAALAIRDSVKCRRLMESPWYRSRWGDRFVLTSDQNEKSRFENDKTGCRIALGVGGAATGEGGDRVVVDDPHNIREAESDTIRQGTLDWWEQGMSTRLH